MLSVWTFRVFDRSNSMLETLNSSVHCGVKCFGLLLLGFRV